MPYEQFQTVQLAVDVPDEGLKAGWDAVILDVYDNGDYEVEVFDGNDETVFVGALPGSLLAGVEHEAPAASLPVDFVAVRPELLARLRAADTPMDRSRALATYITALPVRPLSRCPLTGTVVERAIDDVDLDGPWWDYEQPARPPSPHLPTLVSLTGALRLGAVPNTPFLAVPGPEKPFVVPHLLRAPGVVAVVSELRIGPHTGYPIAYFAPPPGPGLEVERPNDWGSFRHFVQGPRGIEERHGHPYEREWDYDLAPWIEDGRLRWIASGDASIELRDTVEGCPYLGLEGHAGITRLQDGEVWWPDDID